MSPFGTFDTDINYPENKELALEAHEAAAEFNKLDVMGRRIVWGKIYEEQHRMKAENSKDKNSTEFAGEISTIADINAQNFIKNNGKVTRVDS